MMDAEDMNVTDHKKEKKEKKKKPWWHQKHPHLKRKCTSKINRGRCTKKVSSSRFDVEVALRFSFYPFALYLLKLITGKFASKEMKREDKKNLFFGLTKTFKETPRRIWFVIQITEIVLFFLSVLSSFLPELKPKQLSVMRSSLQLTYFIWSHPIFFFFFRKKNDLRNCQLIFREIMVCKN